MKLRVIYLCVISIWGYIPFFFSQSEVIFNGGESGTWTLPCGVTDITVEIWAAGGGGGKGVKASSGGGGGGGGGGEYIIVSLSSLSAGSQFTYNVGIGGSGSSGGGDNGIAGGDSNFDSYIAQGGKGGFGLGGAGGAGGSYGGIGSLAGSNGDNGNIPVSPNGGAGGNNGLNLNGAPTTTSDGVGLSGGIGGGGAGGMKPGGGSSHGGSGGNGQIKITYTDPYIGSFAGADLEFNCNDFTSQNLGAVPASIGYTGTWSIVSGTLDLGDLNSESTSFLDLGVGECVTLSWTISAPGCIAPRTDDVTLCRLLCNDNPCGSLGLSGFTSCNPITVDNTGASQTLMADPLCGGGSLYPENDVWYNMVVPSTGEFTLTFSPGTMTDAAAAIYSSDNQTCSGGFTELVCDDDSGNGLMPAVSVSGQNPGDTLWVRLWEYGGDFEGTFDVCATLTEAIDCSSPTTNDCQGAMPLCSNSPVSDLASGQGCVADLNSSNDGCLAGEHNTSWFYIMIDDPGDGTWGFDGVFDVGSNGIEYDWALWEATGDPTITSSPCTNLGTPIRCSYASQTGKSEVAMGMNASDTDLSENSSPSGNGYTYWLDNVQQGDIYILMVDRYSTAGGAFDLNFTGGATMDCSITEPPVVLPVEYTNIYGKAIEQTNLISWTTEQEVHNDFFTLQKSTNGTLWSSIGTVDGAGNSSVQNSYRFLDTENINGLRYYRIKQTDFNGLEKISEPIAVSNTNFDPFGTIFPNPVINEFSIEYSGNHLNSTYNLSIVDEMGRVVKVFNTMLKHDNNFSVPELNRGVYSVILKATDGTFYRRILID